MSDCTPRTPGTYLRTRKGVLERQCKACRRWKPQTTEFFKLNNKALIRKAGNAPSQVWDCRCYPCSKALRKAYWEQTKSSIRPSRAPRKVQGPKLSAIPPPLDLGSMLTQLLECPQRASNRPLGDSAIRAWGDDD